MLRRSGKRFVTEIEYNNLVANISGISSTLSGSAFYEIGQEIIFQNLTLSEKVVSAGVWVCSGTSSVIYEVARYDGTTIDVDRYLVSSLSGTVALISTAIKDFPEHHSNSLPAWYKKSGLTSSLSST